MSGGRPSPEFGRLSLAHLRERVAQARDPEVAQSLLLALREDPRPGARDLRQRRLPEQQDRAQDPE